MVNSSPLSEKLSPLLNYSFVGLPVRLFLSILNISCQSLLACKFSGEKSADCYEGFLVCNKLFFLLIYSP